MKKILKKYHPAVQYEHYLGIKKTFVCKKLAFKTPAAAIFTAKLIAMWHDYIIRPDRDWAIAFGYFCPAGEDEQ